MPSHPEKATIREFCSDFVLTSDPRPFNCDRCISQVVMRIAGLLRSIFNPSKTTANLKTWQIRALDVVVGTTVIGLVGSVAYEAARVPSALKELVIQASFHPVFQDRIGDPISIGWTWSGSADDLQAHVEIPVKGPIGSGKIFGKCFRKDTDNPWTIVGLFAEFDPVDGVERKEDVPIIDLLERNEIKLVSDAPK